MDKHQEVTLLTPGPTPIHPAALAAMQWPMRSHMDADIFDYNDQIVADLHQLYKTGPGAFVSLLSGTGSLGIIESPQLNGAVEIPHIIKAPNKSNVMSLFSRKYFIILFSILIF